MVTQTLKGAGRHSWDREEGQEHNILQSGPGNLHPVCWIPIIWNYFLGLSFVLQWYIIRLDEIPWITRRDTANNLGNPCFKGYVQNNWFLFFWLICSVYMKIKSLSTRNTFWIHTGKTFGFKGRKKYCSLIKVSIDSKTLNMYLGAWNLKPSQILTPLSKNPIQKQQVRLSGLEINPLLNIQLKC